MYFVVVSVTDVAVLMTPFNIKITRCLNIKVISTEDAVDELIRWVENDYPSDGEDSDENNYTPYSAPTTKISTTGHVPGPSDPSK